VCVCVICISENLILSVYVVCVYIYYFHDCGHWTEYSTVYCMLKEDHCDSYLLLYALKILHNNKKKNTCVLCSMVILYA